MGPNINTDRGRPRNDHQANEQETIYIGVDDFVKLTKELEIPANILGDTLHFAVQAWGSDDPEILLVCPGEPLREASFDEQVHPDGPLEFRVRMPGSYPGHAADLLLLLRALLKSEDILGIIRTHVGWEAVDKHINNLRKAKIRRSPWKDLIVQDGFRGSCMKRSSTSDFIDFKFAFENEEPVIVVVNEKHPEYKKRVASNPGSLLRLLSLPLRIWLRVLFHRKAETEAAETQDSSPTEEEDKEAVPEADSQTKKWWWPFSSGKEKVNSQKIPATDGEGHSPPDLAVAATNPSHTLNHNNHLSLTQNSLKQPESWKESAHSQRKKRKHTAQRHLPATGAFPPPSSTALIASNSITSQSFNLQSHSDQAALASAVSEALHSLSPHPPEQSPRTPLSSSPSSSCFHTPVDHISPVATEYHTPIDKRSEMTSPRASSPDADATILSEHGSQAGSSSPQRHGLYLSTTPNASLADADNDLPQLLTEEESASTIDNKDRDVSDAVFQRSDSPIPQSTRPPHEEQEVQKSPSDLLPSPSSSRRPPLHDSRHHDASHTITSETGSAEEQEQSSELDTRATPITFIKSRTQARLDAHPEIASSCLLQSASGEGSSAGQSSGTAGSPPTDTSNMPTRKQRDNRRIKRRKQKVKRKRAVESSRQRDARADNGDESQSLVPQDESISESSDNLESLNETQPLQKPSTEQDSSVPQNQDPKSVSPAEAAPVVSEDIHQPHSIAPREENETHRIEQSNQRTQLHPQPLQSQHCDGPAAAERHPDSTINDTTTSADESVRSATEYQNEQTSSVESPVADFSGLHVSTDSVPGLSTDVGPSVTSNHAQPSQSAHPQKSEDSSISEAASTEQQPAEVRAESPRTINPSSVIVQSPSIEPSQAYSPAIPNIESRNREDGAQQQSIPPNRHPVLDDGVSRAVRRGRPPRRGRQTRASFRNRPIDTTTQRVHSNSSSAEGTRGAVTNAELQGCQDRRLPAPEHRTSPAVEHRDEQPERQRTSTTVLTGTNHAAATRSHYSGQVAENSIGRVPIQHGTVSSPSMVPEHGSPGATVIPAADSLSSLNRHPHHQRQQQEEQRQTNSASHAYLTRAASSRRRGNSNRNTRGRFCSRRGAANNSTRNPLSGRAAPFNPEEQEFHQRRSSFATATSVDSLLSTGTSGDHARAPRPDPLHLSSSHLSYGWAAVLAPTVADSPTAMVASSASSVIVPVHSNGRGPTFPSNETYDLNDRRVYLPAFGPALPPAADDPSISGRYERTEYGTRPWTAPTTGGWWWNLDSEGFPCAKHDCQRRCNLWDGVSTICPKCGPYSKVRYCSRDHLLGDIAQHWPWCGTQAFQQPCKDSTVPRDLRQGPPMLPSKHRWDCPERHRQAVHFNMNQRRGDYFIFADWPEYVGAGWPEDLASIRCSSEILCVVKFEDPAEKDRFRRVLGACLFASIEHVKMVEYLYRLVRDRLRTEGEWTSHIDAALRYQLHVEMHVRIHPLAVGQRHACETEWDGRHPRHCADEVCRAERPPLLADVEMGRGYRRLVEVMESAYWLLRAARTTHPDVRQVAARVRGEGFEDVMEEDRRLFWRGEGWDGLNTGEMEVEGVNL